MPVSKSQQKAVNKYMKNNYDRIILNLRKDDPINKESVKAAAQASGKSLNGFIISAIHDKMEAKKPE